MSRRSVVFILLSIVLAAAPVFAQEHPLSVGPVVGAGIPGDFLPSPVGISARYAILDWLSLRADAGCILLIPIIATSEFPIYPEFTAGVEVGPFAGFYAKIMGGTWLAGDVSDIFPLMADLGVGFGIEGFFAEAAVALIMEDATLFPMPFIRLGYRFAL